MNIEIKDLLSPQAGFTAGAFAIAGFSIREVISIFRKLVADVDALHDRMLAVEIRAGIVPESRMLNTGHEPERRSRSRFRDRPRAD